MSFTKVSGLVTTAGVNIFLIAIFLAIYSVCRRQPGNASIYFARHLLKRKKEETKEAHFSVGNLIPSINWVTAAWRASEEEILDSAGLDALVFIRVFVFSLRFFSICTLVGLLVLMPLNYINGEFNLYNLTQDALDKFTISNVPAGSNRLWVHFCALYCISFVAYSLLYVEYRNVTNRRIQFLRNSQPQPNQFTVLVRAIPKADQKTYSEQVEDFFSKYYLTYFLHHVVYHVGNVQAMMQEAERLIREMEALKSKPLNGRLPQRTGFLGLFGPKIDPVDACSNALETLHQSIKKSQSEFLQKGNELPVAFVSFKTRWGAAMAAQTEQTPNPLEWVTEWAPEPRDVHWHNLSIPYSQLWIRKMIVGVLVFFITVLFVFPIAFVTTLSELGNLEKWFPAVKALLAIPGVSSLITGYLPSLLLTILYFFIPTVILMLSKVEGYASRSCEEIKTCGKVFYFLLGNMFFLVTSGSLLSLIYESITSPKQIPSLLASGVSGQANFFVSLILTKGWTGFSTEILQVDVLLLYFLLRLFRRQREGPYIQPLRLYRALPNLLLFIFIGLMYTIMAPLLLPFLLIYLILGYLVFRNQILNVYEPSYETGGQYWPHVHNRVVVSIFIMQITCIGIFGLKEKAEASALCIPLPVFTLLFYHYCNMRFFPVFKHLSVQITMNKDEDDENHGLKEDMFRVLQKAYLCPTLQPIQRSANGSTTLDHLLSSDQELSSP